MISTWKKIIFLLINIYQQSYNLECGRKSQGSALKLCNSSWLIYLQLKWCGPLNLSLPRPTTGSLCSVKITSSKASAYATGGNKYSDIQNTQTSILLFFFFSSLSLPLFASNTSIHGICSEWRENQYTHYPYIYAYTH